MDRPDLQSFANDLFSSKSEASAEQISSGALEFVFDSLPKYSDEQLNALYQHVVGEVASRNLEEDIMGEADSSKISLDEEMNEMIKLVRRMRTNLTRATIGGKTVSNREIRETLSACISATKALTSHQKSILTLERQRILETLLVETLGAWDKDTQEKFLADFRERLEEASQ